MTVAAPCPASTYGDREGLAAESECTSCDGGYYCPTEGNLIVPLFFLNQTVFVIDFNIPCGIFSIDKYYAFDPSGIFQPGICY